MFTTLRACFFVMIWITIYDAGKLRPWCTKATIESALGKDSSITLMHNYPSDLGSLILNRIISKKFTLIR